MPSSEALAEHSHNSSNTWLSKLLFRQQATSSSSNNNGNSNNDGAIPTIITRETLSSAGDTYIPIVQSSSLSNLSNLAQEQPLPVARSASDRKLSIPSSPSDPKELLASIDTVLDSCHCCGTVIKYPSNVFKVKCLVCHTNIIVKESSGLSESSNDEHHDSTPPLSYHSLKKLIANCKKQEEDNNNNNPHVMFRPIEDYLFKSFSSYQCLNSSFKLDPKLQVSHRSPNLNFNEVKKFYTLLLNLPTKRPIFKAFLGALHLLRHPPVLSNPSSIIWLLILLEIPILPDCLISGNTTSNTPSIAPELKASCYDILKRVIGLLSYSDKKITKYLIHWWSRLPDVEFIKKVDFINLYITFQLTRCINYELYNSVIKPGAYLSNHNVNDDINYKETLNAHFIRPTTQSSNSGFSIGMPLYVTSGGRRVNNSRNMSFISCTQQHDKNMDHDIKIRLQQYGDDWHLRTAGRLSSFLFVAKKDKKVSDANFYNNLADYVNVKQDFDAWQFNCSTSKKRKGSASEEEDSLQKVIDYIKAESKASYLGVASQSGTMKKSTFTFCQFPFLLSLAAKISILEYEAKRSMERKAEEAFIQSLNKKMPFDVYFKIRVRRAFITVDSLRCIKNHQADFKKLLKVEFVDEPGIDVGGLKKEWFLLLTKDLFHPDKGLFSYNEDSNLGYFAISSIENSELYYLVGVVLGLAIYNSTILDLRLPKTLFKKLMHQRLNLNDFIELNPEAGHGLKKLSKTKNVEQLELTFEVTYKTVFGEVITSDLIPNGSHIKVINENLNLYIEKYYLFFLDEIIKVPYESFSNGFHSVIGGNALSLFTPEEIELILLGDDNNNQKIDVDILRSVTKYNGFGPNDIEIQWFWEYFQNLSLIHQRKLLLFVTGSDRLPATGLPSMIFKITKMVDDDDTRLPIAHTCFNEICLHAYKTKQILVDKLQMAIEYSEGFGLR
ncbi:hypothetical protein CANARDRAFT_30526 [[Candida] arabinofermentans NRRL YB-2248]|uniref:HECT-type E3 ubiquitin transferase n=1 Tax=[Candida] arabinofermentans NRRL YB-2248 TaxID=983967 RepID=A0A1E4STG7_9ASCO|nr:hypothetical protein CANARDRAFT_30526 [[Candida] arabinofermentans NRRL YB-2248]